MPVLAASSVTGEGIDAVRAALRALVDDAASRGRCGERTASGWSACDSPSIGRSRSRAAARSSPGASAAARWRRGATLRREPGGEAIRVREIQVHDRALRPARRRAHGGQCRGAIGRGAASRRRADVGPGRRRHGPRCSWICGPAPAVDGVPARSPGRGAQLRLHVGTDQVDATLRRLPGHPTAALLMLERPTATFLGDRAVLREPASRRRRRWPSGARRPTAPRRLAQAHDDRAARSARAPRSRTAIRTRWAHARTSTARSRSDAAADRAGPLAGACRGRASGARGGRPRRGRDAPSRRAAERRAATPARTRRAPPAPALPRDDRAERHGPRRSRRDRASSTSSSRAGRARARRGGAAGPGARRRAADGPGRGDGPTRAGARRRGSAAARRGRRAGRLPARGRARARRRRPDRSPRTGPRLGDVRPITASPRWRSIARERRHSRRRPTATPRERAGSYVLAILEDLDRRGILVRTPEGHVPGPRAPRAVDAASREPAP